jgi:hypothetical protein
VIESGQSTKMPAAIRCWLLNLAASSSI